MTARPESEHAAPIGLAAFDLDGTLTRGDTVGEVIARGMRHLDCMRELEAIAVARPGHPIVEPWDAGLAAWTIP